MRKPGLGGSFWPSATQEALLRLVCGNQDRVATRWRRLQPLDIDTLELGSFSLLPLVHRRLTEASVSDPLLPRLAGTYHNTWYRNQLKLERLSTLVEALRASGVEPLVFGGAPLAVFAYPHVGLRPIPQLDVIVAPPEARAAAEVVRGCGWQPVGESAATRRFAADETFLALHAGVPVYLAGPLPAGKAAEVFRAHAQERRLGELTVTTLDPADELLFACGLGARAAVPSVQWLLDAYQLLARRDQLDLDLLVNRTRRVRLVRPVQDAVAYLGDVADAPLAVELIAALDREQVSRRDRLAHRLAGAAQGRRGRILETCALCLRVTGDDPLPRAIRRLPGRLRAIWGVDSAAKLPLVALKKTWSYRGLTPTHARPSAHSSVADRKRSASS